MFRKLLIASVIALGSVAQANTVAEMVAQSSMNAFFSTEVEAQGFNFKVGDSANYKMDMGFIKGTMAMTVKTVAADEVVIGQDMDLGFMGKQNCEMTINPQTGETKKMICNGQEQQKGNKDDVELVESKEDTVTVPAGTFTCLYIKAKQKSQNVMIEQWVNPKEIPVFGLAKTIAPTQMGQMVIELTSFKRN